MSLPGISLASRNQARLHARHYLVQIQHRGFAEVHVLQQEPLHRGISRENGEEASTDGFNGSHANTHGLFRGRYSKQALAPHSILEILHEDGLSNTKKPSRSRREQSHSEVAEHNQRTRDLERVNAKLQQFIRGKKNGSTDNDIWRALQDFANDPAASGLLQRLPENSWFMAACIGLAIRCAQHVGNGYQVSVPQPSEVLALLRRFKLDSSDLWSRVLWEAAASVIEKTAGEADSDVTESAVHELVSLWNMALAHSVVGQHAKIPTKGTIFDWSFLPNLDGLSSILRGPSDSWSGMEEALRILLPQNRVSLSSRSHQLARDYTSAMLATLSLLRSKSGHVRADYLPFSQLLETLLLHAPMKGRPFALTLRASLSLELEIRNRWAAVINSVGLRSDTAKPSAQPAVPDQAETKPSNDEDCADQTMPHSPYLQGSSPESTPANFGSPLLTPPIFSHHSDDALTNRFVELRMKRIGLALQRRNIDLAESIKREILQFEAGSGKPKLPNELYEYLMLVLLALRNPASAIEVWNFFIRTGKQPTARTYTNMMKGSQHVRDLNGMESFWRKMRSAGIQPDHHAWSTLIFGLIKGGKVDAGIEALRRMSQEWLIAAKAEYEKQKALNRRKARGVEVTPTELIQTFAGDVGGVPRPSVVIMNSAASALAQRNDREIPKLLAWGKSWGLTPDLKTYNVLLSVAMRYGQDQEAVAILKGMRERGVSADSTTWTVLLTSFFEDGNLNEQSPEELQGRVLGVIKALESASEGGIDEKGYALIIDRLLKYHSNDAAAQAVLRHMIASGKRPTAHLYTILMAWYFQREPPDFVAVEALWEQIQAAEGGRGATVDGVFYDRMIESYSQHHRTVGTGRALQFYQLALSKNHMPSWNAMESLARALLDNGERDRLVQVIEHARRYLKQGSGTIHVGPSRYGRRRFWEFVLSTGLLDGEDVEWQRDLREVWRKSNTVMDGAV